METKTTGSKNMTTTLTANETQALDSLRANAEGFSQTTSKGTWAGVYLNNAKPNGWNAHAWASVLGSLERKGLYRVDDGDAFGLVLVAN